MFWRPRHTDPQITPYRILFTGSRLSLLTLDANTVPCRSQMAPFSSNFCALQYHSCLRAIELSPTPQAQVWCIQPGVDGSATESFRGNAAYGHLCSSLNIAPLP